MVEEGYFREYTKKQNELSKSVLSVEQYHIFKNPFSKKRDRQCSVETGLTVSDFRKQKERYLKSLPVEELLKRVRWDEIKRKNK